MNNEIDNMQDLFDDNIGRALRQLGFVFPRTAADFRRIEYDVKDNKIVQPERLKDPTSFLSKRHFKGAVKLRQEDEQVEYNTNLAQAARQGKLISEEVKKKMADDKLKSNKKKNDP